MIGELQDPGDFDKIVDKSSESIRDENGDNTSGEESVIKDIEQLSEEEEKIEGNNSRSFENEEKYDDFQFLKNDSDEKEEELDLQMQYNKNVSFFQIIKDLGRNVKYKLGSLKIIGYPLALLKHPSDNIHILGRTFSLSQNENANEMMMSFFSNITWFTYRRKFKPLEQISIKGNKYSSDSGWGCMVRVAQMLLCEVLKRHLLKKDNNYENKEKMKDTIKLFIDENNEPYSIYEFIKTALEKYDTKPGEWFYPIKICSILRDLLEKNPIKKLEMILFNEGIICQDQVYESLEKAKIWPKHTRLESRSSISQTESENYEESEILEKDKIPQKSEPLETSLPKDLQDSELVQSESFENDSSRMQVPGVLIAISTQLGLGVSNQIYLNFLMKLIKCRYFSGIVGGRTSEALYFVGCQNEESLIFLDPHYVQDAVTNNNFEESFETFFSSNNPRLYPISLMSPSLSISFYVGSEEEIVDLFKYLREAQVEVGREGTFISIEEKTPSFLLKS